MILNQNVGFFLFLVCPLPVPLHNSRFPSYPGCCSLNTSAMQVYMNSIIKLKSNCLSKLMPNGRDGVAVQCVWRHRVSRNPNLCLLFFQQPRLFPRSQLSSLPNSPYWEYVWHGSSKGARVLWSLRDIGSHPLLWALFEKMLFPSPMQSFIPKHAQCCPHSLALEGGGPPEPGAGSGASKALPGLLTLSAPFPFRVSSTFILF